MPPLEAPQGSLPDVAVRDRSLIDEVAAALDEDGDPSLAELDDEALADELRSLSSVIAASTCRWLVLLAEVVRRGVWSHHGATTPAHWLSWAVGMAPSTAREHVRVALRLRRFPLTTAEFAAGRLSFSKVRAITRTDLPELEDLLVIYAKDATASQLDRIVAGFRATRPPDDVDPWANRSVTWRRLDDGVTARITIDLPVEEAAESNGDARTARRDGPRRRALGTTGRDRRR